MLWTEIERDSDQDDVNSFVSDRVPDVDAEKIVVIKGEAVDVCVCERDDTRVLVHVMDEEEERKTLLDSENDALGVGDGVAVGVGVGVGVGVMVVVGVMLGVHVMVPLGVTDADGVAETEGDSVTVGESVRVGVLVIVRE